MSSLDRFLLASTFSDCLALTAFLIGMYAKQQGISFSRSFFALPIYCSAGTAILFATNIFYWTKSVQSYLRLRKKLATGELLTGRKA